MILWVNGHHGHLAKSSKRIAFRGQGLLWISTGKMYRVDIVAAQIWLNCQDQGKNQFKDHHQATENHSSDNHKICLFYKVVPLKTWFSWLSTHKKGRSFCYKAIKKFGPDFTFWESSHIVVINIAAVPNQFQSFVQIWMLNNRPRMKSSDVKQYSIENFPWKVVFHWKCVLFFR